MELLRAGPPGSINPSNSMKPPYLPGGNLAISWKGLSWKGFKVELGSLEPLGAQLAFKRPFRAASHMFHCSCPSGRSRSAHHHRERALKTNLKAWTGILSDFYRPWDPRESQGKGKEAQEAFERISKGF